MPLKIAIIGAGSIGFTRSLMKDMLGVPEFQDTIFAFHDINKRNLDMITRLARRDIAANKLPAKVIPTLNRREAIKDADYIVSVVRVGGLEAFQLDIDIPLKYGVDQCVGDTLCAGGIMYGQRNIPCILDFCKDIREVAKPGAIFFNYANPNCMNVWAANEYGGVKTIGLCHGVQGGHWQITEVIKLLVNGDKKPGDPGYRHITTKDVDIICAGINHQTWYIQVRYDGQDWTSRLLEGFEKHPVFSKTEKVRIDMLRRFGYYSTESNGHLSEYVPWYRKRLSEIKNWISLDCWINGETGGYLRVCTEGRRWFETDFPRWLKEKPPVFGPEHRGHEHVSYIIEALQTGRIYRGHFIVPNRGCITNLPDDAMVEVPCYVDRNGISVPRIGDLPLGCAAVCNASISVQRLAVKAAVTGDVALLKQAMMMDPLVGAVCTPPEISQMTDEMLVAQAKWLPQYKHAIPEAKKRLAVEKPLARYGTKGAARLKTKTVAEIRRDIEAREMAAAADKAMAKRQAQVAKQARR
ncbi:MAG: alpha-glucosidase/alpha-galactosidase [Planctomycetota bacterium]|nr:alpha-glucosidase/alpha-galactosidase [Planctomycetota bacterium]